MGNRKTAIEFFNQGVTASKDKSNPQNISTAYQLFLSAAYQDPTFWQAHHQCGCNASDLLHFHAAIASWRRALECEMKPQERGRVLSNLAQRLHTIGRVTEALPLIEEAVRLLPSESGPWVVASVIYATLNRAKDSLRTAEMAYAINPTDTLVQMVRTFAYLFDGQLRKGFEHFECRFRYKLFQFTQFPYPKWRGEENATIFLVADQGMGDSLSFARFVPEVLRRSRFVHIATQPELTSTFQYAFRRHDNVDIIPLNPHFRQADYWTSFDCLPVALDLTDDQIRDAPPIEVPVNHIASSWKVTDRKLHVGIAWRGSHLNDINEFRSIPVTQFLELYRVPGIQLYALQIGEHAKDQYDAGCAAVMVDLSRYVRDVTDTIALLQHLDLVITCESALGHICAVANKEVWIPYSHMGRDFRIGYTGERMMWLPTTRVFCQQEGETWQPVFDRIVEALREKVDGLAGKA